MAKHTPGPWKLCAHLAEPPADCPCGYRRRRGCQMTPAFAPRSMNQPSESDILAAAEWFGKEPEDVTADDVARWCDDMRAAWAEEKMGARR